MKSSSGISTGHGLAIETGYGDRIKIHLDENPGFEDGRGYGEGIKSVNSGQGQTNYTGVGSGVLYAFPVKVLGNSRHSLWS